jgi:hypothetical protein
MVEVSWISSRQIRVIISTQLAEIEVITAGVLRILILLVSGAEPLGDLDGPPLKMEALPVFETSLSLFQQR